MEPIPHTPPATLTFILVLLVILGLGALALSEGPHPLSPPATGGAATPAATAVPPGGAVGPGPAR